MGGSIQEVVSPIYGGGLAREGMLYLKFPYRETDKTEIAIYGTADSDAARAKPQFFGAAMIWAYITLYMEKGKAALPPFAPEVPKHGFRSLGELFKAFNPIPNIPKWSIWLPISLPFFLFLELPGTPLVILSDLIYMGLDRLLPRRKWPQELLEACDHVWDGSNDYGPRCDVKDAR